MNKNEGEKVENRNRQTKVLHVNRNIVDTFCPESGKYLKIREVFVNVLGRKKDPKR